MEEALARWARERGVEEAYAFEDVASSHGGTEGSYLQVWRGASGSWWAVSLPTSFSGGSTDHPARIGDRAARCDPRRLQAALGEVAFWSAPPWREEELRSGTDGRTLAFAGLRGGERRLRSVWSGNARTGAPVVLRAAFEALRPSWLRSLILRRCV